LISSPRITTLNNQKATIKVITNLFLQKQQKSTDSATTVTVEFEKDPREVGVILEVTPHVNDKGEISVTLKPEVSTTPTFTELELTGDDNTVSMQYNSRVAETQIMVRDGETIFIGGLIQDTLSKEDHKVPILGDLLGDIPLVGGIFKYEQDNVDKTEVVFFVTVHLLKDGKDSINSSKTISQYQKVFTEGADTSKAQAEEYAETMIRRETGSDDVKLKRGNLKSIQEDVSVSIPNSGSDNKADNKPFLDFRKK